MREINTIKISNEEGKEIINLYKNKNPNTMYEDNFAFNEFSLFIGNFTRLEVSIEQGNRKFKISGMIGTREQFPIKFEVLMENMKRKYRFAPQNDDDNAFISQHQKDLEERMKAISEWVFIIIYHIMAYPRKTKYAVSSHKYSREYRISTKTNKIYLLSDVIKYVSNNYIPESGHHNIQCPCWEVRGHYRHYKTGKVVFIPSYKKGKDKDKAEPKPHEYYL